MYWLDVCEVVNEWYYFLVPFCISQLSIRKHPCDSLMDSFISIYFFRLCVPLIGCVLMSGLALVDKVLGHIHIFIVLLVSWIIDSWFKRYAFPQPCSWPIAYGPYLLNWWRYDAQKWIVKVSIFQSCIVKRLIV